MTLSTEQIERYSRQVILPEVGARGQERLLAATVSVGGGGPAATTAALLLGRAGVGTLVVPDGFGSLPELSPDCAVRRHAGAEPVPADVDVGLSEPGAGVPFALEPAARPLVVGLVRDARIVVATLVGRPCRRCWLQALHPEELDGGAPGDPAPAAALTVALGALAASEALRVLLAAPATGRLTRLDLEHGAAAARDLASGGCSCCGVPS